MTFREVRGRHAEYFYQMAEGSQEKLHGPDQVEWLNRYKIALDNIRSALGYGRQKGLVAAASAAASLWWFFFRGGVYKEGRTWLAEMIKNSSITLETKAKLLYGKGFLDGVQGDYEMAEENCDEAIDLAHKAGDDRSIAWAYWSNIATKFHAGDYGAILQSEDRALAACRSSGDRICLAETLRFIGFAQSYQGDYAQRDRSFEESLRIFEELGDMRGIAHARLVYSYTFLLQEEYIRAKQQIRGSLEIARQFGDKWSFAYCFESIAIILAFIEKQFRKAAKLFGAAYFLLEEINAPLASTAILIHDKSVAAARKELGEDAFKAAWEEGGRMALDEAIAYALEEEVEAEDSVDG